MRPCSRRPRSTFQRRQEVVSRDGAAGDLPNPNQMLASRHAQTVGVSLHTGLRDADFRAEFGLGDFPLNEVFCEGHADIDTKLVSKVKSGNTTLVLDTAGIGSYRVGMSQLKRLREQARLTQDELADKIGSQQPQIVRWEKHPSEKDFRKIPLGWAVKLATFFQCDVGTFRPEVRGAGLDALLTEAEPEIKQQVREYAEYLLAKKTGT